MQRNDQAVGIDPSLVPEADEYIRQSNLQGGNITMFSPFGKDPLEMHQELYQERQQKFLLSYPDFGPFLYCG